MSKKNWGLWFPFLSTAIVLAVVALIRPRPSTGWGIALGLAAWKKKFFYWVWAGGMFFRMLVFAATAYVVYVHTRLGFVATMTTMVFATTVFLVVESTVLFSKPTT
jgi:hypothetical protein